MKVYGIDVLPQSINMSASFRNKSSLLCSIIEIARLLNYCDMQSPESLPETIEGKKVRLVVLVEKMSRCFICENGKIHSFVFPFSIVSKECRLIPSFEGEQITSSICSVLAAVFKDLPDDECVENVIERYWDIAGDFELDQQEITLCGRLIVFLLSIEPGYLRYDNDPYRINGDIHPQEHIDINYSTATSFKVGLNKGICINEFIDILNTNTSCYYLEKH